MIRTNQELFEAAEKGDTKRASRLLAEGVAVNSKNKDGDTPLIVAAKRRHNHEMIKLLLESGADISSRDQNSKTALMNLASIGLETKTLKLFLKYSSGYKNVTAAGRLAFLRLIDETSNEANLIVLLRMEYSYTELSGTVWPPLLYAAHLANKRKAFLVVAEQAQKAGDPLWADLDPATLKSNAESASSLIRYLVPRTKDINGADELGNTALHLASGIQNGNEAVKTLLELGADVNASNIKGFTSLSCAAMIRNNFDTVRLILDNGAEVDARDSLGRTPLTHALKQKADDKTIALLLSRGADPNSKNTWGRTPLMYVSTGVHTVSLLLKAGGDPNAIAKPLIGCGTVLNRIIEAGADTKSVELLLRSGADPNQFSDDVLPPLLQAIETHAPLSVIRLLISNGAEIERKTPSGDTALDLAIASGYDSAASILIAKGAVLGLPGDPQWSPLMHVARFSAREEILYSVARRRKDTDRAWMLLYRMLAVNTPPKGERLIASLLMAGLDANARTMDGKNALFFFSGSPYDVAILEKLIKAGIDVDCRADDGMTALMALSMLSNEALLSRLIMAGAKTADRDLNGNTPLHYVAKGTHVKNLSTLIKNGADVNAVNNANETPLMTAVLGGHHLIAKALIDNGADLEALDGNGNTALLLAVASGSDECVKVLLNAEADILRQNSKGENVLSLAITSKLKKGTRNRITEKYRMREASL